MLIRSLIDGTFLVNIEVRTGILPLIFTKEALLENFELTDIPSDASFEAKPRVLSEYMELRKNR